MDKIPVYILSGFLDCGKTTFIKNVLKDNQFNQGEFTLIITFEQGDEEYDAAFLKATNSKVIYLDSINELTLEKINELDKEWEPERVIIELNGMEDDNILYQQGLPEKYGIGQIITLVDTTTFRTHLINMKQFFYNHIAKSELIIFNRCDDEDKRFLRNNVKAANPSAQILYENSNGKVTDRISEELYDLTKPFEVADLDYGIWYMDAADNADKYDGCVCTLNLKYLETVKKYKDVVIMGRQAMVCCSNDIANIGVTCANVKADDVSKGGYYKLTGRLKALTDTRGTHTCVLYVDSYEPSETPNEELVYFN